MSRYVPVLLAFLLSIPAPAALEASAKRRAPRRQRQVRPERPLTQEIVNDAGLTAPVGPGSSGAAVLRAQVLLARAHFSCGEIDARYGANLKGAIAAFRKSRGLSESGLVDSETWRALNADTGRVLERLAVAPGDVAGPFIKIPEDMMEKAKLPSLSYSSALEAIAEKYHVSPALLRKLNPGASLDRAGEEIVVPNVGVPAPGKAASIAVSKSAGAVFVLDAQGKTIARYPATTGSEHDPLPLGNWKVVGVARNPPFHYNPDLFWDAKETHDKAPIAPGPNNPVGVAWIDLSKQHYGIHGTPEPSQIGKTQSHGCIRLTNWDVTELSQMVSPGTPAVLEE